MKRINIIDHSERLLEENRRAWERAGIFKKRKGVGYDYAINRMEFDRCDDWYSESIEQTSIGDLGVVRSVDGGYYRLIVL